MMILAILLSGCTVTTVGQSGGITACSMGVVTTWPGSALERRGGGRLSLDCLQRRGIMRPNRLGRWNKTAGFKALSKAEQRRLMASCTTPD